MVLVVTCGGGGLDGGWSTFSGGVEGKRLEIPRGGVGGWEGINLEEFGAK